MTGNKEASKKEYRVPTDKQFFCDEEFNGVEGENEDFLATGTLIYEYDPEKPKKDEHHILSAMNAFKLTD